MKSTHWLSIVAVFLLGITTPSAYSQDQGWYVGGGSGSSDDKDLVEEENGFKVFGGYRLNKHLTLEAAVVQLGEFGAEEESSRQGTAWEALGTLPVGKHFELFAKGGIFIWSVTVEEFQCRDIFGSTVCDEFDSATDDGIDLTYGVGTHIHFTRKWGARLEWERFVDVGDSDVDLGSFGVIYKF